MLINDTLNHTAAPSSSSSAASPTSPKRIAIVGGGVAGLGALKALLDLPVHAQQGWVIDLFEERSRLGGIWNPETNVPCPPTLPETPLYPSMRTNNPQPTMHFPNHPYPAGTNLFPSWTVVNAQLNDFVEKDSLFPFCHLSHSVLDASYNDNDKWTLRVSNPSGIFNNNYDHLISANGHNHFPRSPRIEGEELWAGEGRQVLHSMYFRDVAKYKGQIVVVVGNGATGRDEADQLAKAGATVYHSYSTNSIGWAPLPNVHLKPRIARYTPTCIIFEDGTSLSNDTIPISVFYGTGYELRVPYLNSLLAINPNSTGTPTSLETNLRKIGPLHHSVFAIDERLPMDALAFVGLNVSVAYAYNAYAQGFLIAHALCEPELLPSKEEAMVELRRSEQELREAGHEPLVMGHRFPLPHYKNEDYLDSLISHLRKLSPIALPSFLSDPSKPFVEPGIRYMRRNFLAVQHGWLEAEKRGIAEQFMPEGNSVESWTRCVEKLLEWEKGI
ncbi:hypothetical protein BCR35DRAFT_350474 [Leucosporidium creatinivorum]|uniref:FAD/NAD(P)-binding domain-containing protein n=1 Tax=Leucosporidium creatinivorum TaxID=106004 RepID=A0A1Y2FY28_9BASI|nr:hypothetical protein BCR35DRAFT_350474 [Leucosporidium creatinivorum]